MSTNKETQQHIFTFPDCYYSNVSSCPDFLNFWKLWRATLKGLADHKWPAGRVFETPAVHAIFSHHLEILEQNEVKIFFLSSTSAFLDF